MRLTILVLFIEFMLCSNVFAQHNEHPVVIMKTELGNIEFEIFSHEAPVTAANFLEYVRRNMFQGAFFYRVVTQHNQPSNPIKIEVIQGGLGWSDSLARLAPIKHETTQQTGIKHLDGTLSMARDQPGSAASEFFICINAQPELDFGGKRNPDGQGFAAFGRVITGMEVVRKIQHLPNTNQFLKPVIKILAVEIR